MEDIYNLFKYLVERRLTHAWLTHPRITPEIHFYIYSRLCHHSKLNGFLVLTQSDHIHTIKLLHVTEHYSNIQNIFWKASRSILTLAE